MLTASRSGHEILPESPGPFKFQQGRLPQLRYECFRQLRPPVHPESRIPGCPPEAALWTDMPDLRGFLSQVSRRSAPTTSPRYPGPARAFAIRISRAERSGWGWD